MKATCDNSVIEKIKKLFALSHSPNESEASIALAKAHKMLQEYNLSEKDLNLDQQKDNEIVDSIYSEHKKTPAKWKMSLLIEIAKVSYCQAYRTIGFNKNNKIDVVLLNVIGTKVNIESCRLFADYIFTAIEYNAKKDMMGKGYHAIEAYKIGFATTLVKRLQLIQTVENNVEEYKALAIREDKRIEDYMGSMVTSKSIIDPTIVDIESYIKGRKIGENFSLNKQIDQENKERIIYES